MDFKMNIGFIIIYLFFFTLVGSLAHSLGKNITKFKKVYKDNINRKVPIILESDNYIVIYFNQDCYYSYGLKIFIEII